MSFPSWLQNLRSAMATRAGQCEPRRRGSRRAATHRLNLEALEDRWLPSFSPITSFPVGPTPLAVVTADFNNDGSLDLAAANYDGSSVSVLLGDGQGEFAAAPQIATVSGPYALAVGDVNNDGKRDLVTVNYPTVSVRLGNGDGTFQLPIDTAPLSGDMLSSVAVADFNADGQMDLVVTSGTAFDEGAGYVAVMLGDGSGLFGSYYILGGWGSPVVQSVADLNADGMPDMIMTDPGLFDFGVGVWLGNGGVLQYSGSTGGAVSAGAVGDFTGDGIPDLVTAGPTVDVRPGNGDGTFASPIHTNVNGTGQTALAAADFNGDGKLDLVTTGGGTVNALLGSGNGTFTLSPVYTVDWARTEFAVGDFNGDGRADVAISNATSNTVSVLLNDGAWSLNAPRLQIGDVALTEGNAGTASATFTVTLSAASTDMITVAYATGNGTATAGSDYQTTSGTLTFSPGQTSKTITVLVNGDRLPEPNETFSVNLTSPTNATIADGQGVGTIHDDEPRISITDVSKSEGKKNQTTQFTFTVTLSAAYDQPVTMSFQTVNGTATTSDGDYVAKSGTLTFKPGETSKTITIEVKGDGKQEANESFYLDLFDLSSNALFTKKRGTGTILNDD